MRSRALQLILAALLAGVLASCSKPANDATANTADQNGASPSTTEGTAAEGKTARKAEEQPVVIPAGTTLTVRLGEAVGSKISTVGLSFTATLTSPV